MSKWCCCGSHRRDASSKDTGNSAETPVQLPGPNKTCTSQQNQANTAERSTDDQKPAKPVRADSASVPLGIPAEIETLIVEDSKSEDNKPSLPRKASIVFSIVRSKLLRHAPAEHDERRQSHISVRNSEEEIARRAELRRLRHKRIQDELHHDISGDDTSNISPNSLRQPHSLTSLYQACIGPRDVLEFTVPDRIKDAIDSNSPTSSIKLGCLPNLPKVRQGDHKGDLDSKQKRLGSKEHAGEVHLWPVHLRQDHPSSSNTGPRMAEAVSRKSLPTKSTTSAERDHSVRADSYLKEDDQSTLGVWLIAQAMQSEDNEGNRAESDHTVVRNDTAGENSVQSDKEYPEESHKRLSQASMSFPDPPEQPSSRLPSPPSPPPGDDAIDNVAEREDDSESDVLQFFPIFAKSLLGEAPEIAPPSPPSKSAPDSSSSKYNSHRPSILPSPSRSQPNVHNLSLRDLRNLDLSPFQWHPNSSFAQGASRSEGPSSYATAEDRQSGHETDVDAAPVAWRSSPLPADASSASQSETPSFRKREAELQTIQARFGDVLARKKLPATFQSRFKEEFSDSELPENQEASLLSKIHGKSPKSSAKRSKHSNLLGDWSAGSLAYSDENKATVSTESKRHSSLRPNAEAGLGKPTIEASRTIAERYIPWWEKVTKPDESKKRNSRTHAARLSLPRGISSPPTQNEASSPIHLTDLAQILSGPEPAVPIVAEPPTQIGQPRQAITPRIDESSIGVYGTRLNLPDQPSLWESYPSHLFEERNGSASIKDRVTAQDFATSTITANAAPSQNSKQAMLSDTDNDTADKSALQERLVRVFRTSISKLVPLMDSKRHDTERPTSNPSATITGSIPEGDQAEGDIDEGPKSNLAGKGGGHSPTTLATTKLSTHEDCTPKILDIARTVGDMPGSAAKTLAPIECSSEPVLPRLDAASIRNLTAQTARESGLVMPGLRPMMSDYSLQHSLRRYVTPGENINRRSMPSISQ